MVFSFAREGRSKSTLILERR